MRKLKGLSRRLVATCVILVAGGAVIVPAAVQGHPVQNPITLKSPANGACVNTPTPTLEWYPRQHAEKYKIKLISHPDASREDQVAYEWVYGNANTSWTAPYLDNHRWYHWGVKGSNDYHGVPGFGDGPWSDIWYFYTCY